MNASANADRPLLSVEGLTTTFDTDAGVLTAVDGVDFDVRRGETVCIVGESGSGKTVASESVTRLIPSPPGTVEGSIRFGEVERVREFAERFPKRVVDAADRPERDGADRVGDDDRFVVVEERTDGEITRGYVDLARAPETALRRVRGADITHVFQNPQDALNHCYTVGWQIVEAIQVHEDVGKAAARERAVDLLERVGIANAATRFDDYPHEFSGGQKQRVMIAMALATNPDLLIADEPTTALDVTVQSQILDLIADIQREYGMGILFITHDLGVVAEIADRVVVMYAGKVMERGDVYEIFETPSHPYTRALIDCLPGGGRAAGGIEGTLPNPVDPPDGCRFAPRCPYAVEECTVGEQPPEIPLSESHRVSCVYYGEGFDESVIVGSADEEPSAEGGTADD
ncbi:peptide ABC transporter ATPase [Halogeometricum pallidum JCM 14848]|uniref:Nickel import system ATP-binding protein NikD n=1 Tax=Halogeometricum pallidum JCM 14848 TaxID=1227487 RepID=M0CW98_HALPD|nr:ABC transporter ATP-binding protein [Halogeometricum pallidum]ELZ26722.1 peptide ABC transporter ATPase [Halogeometricum pallidum JCM 14848]